jgi:hypothetical protein
MAISSHDADKFRLKHAEELLALFEEARGRPARTTDELARWLDSVHDDLADDIRLPFRRESLTHHPAVKVLHPAAGIPHLPPCGHPLSPALPSRPRSR